MKKLCILGVVSALLALACPAGADIMMTADELWADTNPHAEVTVTGSGNHNIGYNNGTASSNASVIYGGIIPEPAGLALLALAAATCLRRSRRKQPSPVQS